VRGSKFEEDEEQGKAPEGFSPAHAEAFVLFTIFAGNVKN
jgi:hypothetical protein